MRIATGVMQNIALTTAIGGAGDPNCERPQGHCRCLKYTHAWLAATHTYTSAESSGGHPLLCLQSAFDNA